MQDAAQRLADEHQLHELKTIGESDFAVTFADSVRIRCNLFLPAAPHGAGTASLPMEIRLQERFTCRISLYSRPKARADWLS